MSLTESLGIDSKAKILILHVIFSFHTVLRLWPNIKPTALWKQTSHDFVVSNGRDGDAKGGNEQLRSELHGYGEMGRQSGGNEGACFGKRPSEKL